MDLGDADDRKLQLSTAVCSSADLHISRRQIVSFEHWQKEPWTLQMLRLRCWGIIENAPRTFARSSSNLMFMNFEVY